jgi:hypothetical protein
VARGAALAFHPKTQLSASVSSEDSGCDEDGDSADGSCRNVEDNLRMPRELQSLREEQSAAVHHLLQKVSAVRGALSAGWNCSFTFSSRCQPHRSRHCSRSTNWSPCACSWD